MDSRTLLRRASWPLIAAAVLIPAVTFGGEPQHLKPESGDALSKDTETFREHEMLIASPFMEGRAPGTKGNRIAADYIEWTFRQLGLTPAFPSDPDANGHTTEHASYRQPFKAPAHGADAMKLVAQGASYAVDGKTVELKPGRDFNVLGFSANGETTGGLVFGGYSIANKDKNYESYPQGTDLTGKVVMVLRYEPMDDAGHSRWADQRWSVAASLDGKFKAAAEAHAAGIILVSPPGADVEHNDKLEGLALSGPSAHVPVIMMSQPAADALVKAADKEHRSLMDLRHFADANGGTVLLDANVSLKAEIQKIELMTDNVGAILPGKGKLADEFIVIGSHYDHLGYGYFGSMSHNPQGIIHPGADDNASGTSANMLLAKKLSEAYKELPEGTEARSILFLTFSGEESGLIGSRYYVNHMIAPAEKHALMLNMDMVGRLREGKLDVGGVGTAKGLKDWCQPYWDESGLKIHTDMVGPGNSDHAEFYGKKIPDLFFFTGYHPQYHTPEDVVALINYEGSAQVADLVGRIALDAATRPEGFEFTSGRSEGDKPANPHEGGDPNNVGSTGLGVRFGIMPVYGDLEKPGVQIDHISNDKGLPAEKAGLKAGDLMTKWDDHELKDVEQWMTVMAKYKPGDKVVITYVRDGKEMKTTATLVGSGGGKQ